MRPERARDDASRLGVLADLVPHGSRVADVGTDRAPLPRLLLDSGRAHFCVATERDALRLERARTACAGRSLAGRLELRSGDGLAPLRSSDRIDVVVIAGLGGASVARILALGCVADLAVRRLVLQPRTEPALVRRWLAENGFRIVDERIGVERGRFFAAIAAEAGRPTRSHDPAPPLSEEDLLEVGPCLARSGDPRVAAAWRAELVRNEAILRTARGGRGLGRAKAQCRVGLARRVLAALSLGA